MDAILSSPYQNLNDEIDSWIGPLTPDESRRLLMRLTLFGSNLTDSKFVHDKRYMISEHISDVDSSLTSVMVIFSIWLNIIDESR